MKSKHKFQQKGGRHSAGPKVSGGATLDPAASGQIVVGRNPIREILNQTPHRILKIYLAEGRESPEISRLVTQIERCRIPITKISTAALEQLAGGASHQGFAAQLAPLPPVKLGEFLESISDQQKALIVMADSINDPHNLGAIARAAECFGACAVVFSSNRGCSVTPVAVKSSAGAAQLIPMIDVGNLSNALKQCKEAGFWSIATAISDSAVSATQFEMPERALIMMGSEGDGLHDLLLRQADATVYIPMFGAIDSLNVAQATAVMLYRWAATHLKSNILRPS